MSATILSLSAAAASISLFAYPLVRPASRSRFLVADLALHLAAAGLSSILPIDLIFGACIASRILLVGFFVAAPRHVVPIEPWRWMLLAGSLYLSILPHQLQWPIDGDEPYYVLQAHSIAHDFDLDLRNQYARSASIVGQEIGPQLGDPAGPGGELWSRHEPMFAALLAIPVFVAGVTGASVLVALLAAIAAFFFARLLEEEGVAPRARTIAMFAFAFAPPVLFYATRVWPEVPAVLLLVGLIRALRRDRSLEAAFYGIALPVLKLRFLPIVLVVVIAHLLLTKRERGSRRMLLVAGLVMVLPALLMWIFTGDASGIHDARELVTPSFQRYLTGIAGLLFDAQNGILFQAPLLACGALLILARPARAGMSIRILSAGALAYLFLLAPRAEWHGGWSPPLRYLVVLVPLFALSLAHGLQRVRTALADAVVAGAVVTAGIVAHGLARPWQLFHIANGESAFGEALSSLLAADVSRLLPSAVRPNSALVAVAFGLPILAILVWTVRRVSLIRSFGSLPAIVLCVVALSLRASMHPGSVVHFEDAHLQRSGGSLHPERYQVQRFLHDGGWRMQTGDSLRFRMRSGPAVLRYHAREDAKILWNGSVVLLSGGEGWQETLVMSDRPNVEVQVLQGKVILDHAAVR